MPEQLDRTRNGFLQSCDEPLKTVFELLRDIADRAEASETLCEVTCIRKQLIDCLSLAEQQIMLLTERVENEQLIVPDSDPVRVVQGANARRMPDEDSPLPCDPDDTSAN